MKYWFKRVLKSDRAHRIIARIGVGYLRLVLATSRMESHLHPQSLPYFNGQKQAIFALWHSRIMLIHSHDPYRLSGGKRRMCALVSAHRDGRMIGRILEHHQVVTVHGSSSEGGASAMRALMKYYKQGHNLSITPDGPRGPAGIAAEGVAQLAIQMQAPIICISFSATRHRRLRSWDRFMVALPFSRIYFVASAPLEQAQHLLPRSASITEKHALREQLRQTIEQELHRVTKASDQLASPHSLHHQHKEAI